MDQGIAAAGGGPRNPPLALRMGVIAGLSHNIVIGTIFGSFGVLTHSVETRLGATPEMAAAAIPMVVVGSAVLSSAAGVLAARYPLRLLMAVGAALATAGWLLLAFTASYALYLVAYGLLLGPALALSGAVLPPTLVTRWFVRNRGLALGLVHLPIVVAVLPVVSNWVVERFGAQSAYLLLAVLCGLVLLPATLLVVDQPAGATTPADAGQPAAPDRGMSVVQLLASPRFWALTLSVGAINTGSVILGAQLIPMAISWGIERAPAALLASVMSLAGIAGSVLFGWVSDRIGGGRTLALLAFDAALLWALFLAGLPYAALALVVALIGMHGSGAIPALSRAIGEWPGPASFSRAYGLASTAALPITILGVMGTASAFQAHGSYTVAILAMIAYFIVAVPLGLSARSRAVR